MVEAVQLNVDGGAGGDGFAVDLHVLCRDPLYEGNRGVQSQALLHAHGQMGQVLKVLPVRVGNKHSIITA